jgi:hypothetical protein
LPSNGLVRLPHVNADDAKVRGGTTGMTGEMASAVALLGAGWGLATGLCIGFLALLGWRDRRHAVILLSDRASPAPKLAPHSDKPLMTFESRELDVEQEVSAALAQLQDVAHRDRVELQVAVQPKLAVWADPCALQQMLIGVVSQAIERAEGTAVLVSAVWHGGRVQVTIMDDGPAGDRAALIGRLREVAQCAALQGGTLEVECRRPSGNKVMLRMPGTASRDAEPAKDDVSDQPPMRAESWTGVVSVS